MTIEIPLSRGLVALVDDLDVDRVLSVGKWYADRSCQTFYARKNFWKSGGGYTSLKMHRFITGWPYVDHINGNGLDNRRANLRKADDTRNAQNRKRRSDNTSGYKGVSFVHSTGKWVAAVSAGGVRTYLGAFSDPVSAARAYDAAALLVHGEFARLNFPLEDVA